MMATTKTVLSHPEKVLDFVEVTGAILEKSAAMLGQKEAQDKAVREVDSACC
jgi:hypothetical protein